MRLQALTARAAISVGAYWSRADGRTGSYLNCVHSLERAGARRKAPTKQPTNYQFTAAQQKEHNALVALYTATSGDSWANNKAWLTPTTGFSWSYCNWYGVGCSNSWLSPVSNLGYGSKPSFVRNHLRGTLPSALANLTKLDWFDFGNDKDGVPCGADSTGIDGDQYPNYNRVSGTITSSLASLTRLTHVGLSCNRLSGQLPSGLDQLAELTRLNALRNRLSGTLPSKLGALTRLKNLMLFNNELSGTLPSEIGRLTALEALFLHSNQISGSIPSEMGHLTKLRYLFLSFNRLSGTLPSELSSLEQLAFLYLDSNSFSGSMPTELAIHHLLLSSNRLSGTIPLELASATDVNKLFLNDNRLSGTVPSQLASLRLSQLLVSSNLLSGTIPSELAILELRKLFMNNNRFSGPVPSEFVNLTRLESLAISDNMLSGTLPRLPGTHLQLLAAHRNSLSGALPSFVNFSHLINLTVFSNSLWGQLRLPANGTASPLRLLMAHGNRLSCPVLYNATGLYEELITTTNHSGRSRYNKGALIAPGNRLSERNKPAWAIMHDVHFQWVPESIWDEWQLEISAAAVGSLATAVVVCAILRMDWPHFFSFRPTGMYEQYDWFLTQLLFLLGLACLSLLPAYIIGSGEFECGHPWLRTTLSYLSGSAAWERIAAVLICILLGVQGFAIAAIRRWICVTQAHQFASSCTLPEVTDEANEAVPDSTGLSWQRKLVVVLLWPLAVLFFSVPAFLSVLAASVPGDSNSLGLSQDTLDGISYAASALLSIIESVFVPAAARTLVGKGARHRAVGLMIIALSVILIIVPVLTALALGSDCFGLWVMLWDPCQSADNFNIDTLTISSAPAEIAASTTRTPITRHSDVCGAQNPAGAGRCPRFVLQSLGELIVEKMLFTAFINPVATVIVNLPWVSRAREYLMRVLLCRNYRYELDPDAHLVLTSMVFAQAMILGLAVPIVVGIACLVLAGRLAAVHLVTQRFGVRFKHEYTKPPKWWHFMAPLLFGTALLLWFFIDNGNRIEGSNIMYIGAPLAIFIGLAAGWAYYDRPTDHDIVNAPNFTDAPTHVQFAALRTKDPNKIEFESSKLL